MSVTKLNRSELPYQGLYTYQFHKGTVPAYFYSNPKQEWNRGRRGTAPVPGSGKFVFVNQIGLLYL